MLCWEEGRVAAAFMARKGDNEVADGWTATLVEVRRGGAGEVDDSSCHVGAVEAHG